MLTTVNDCRMESIGPFLINKFAGGKLRQIYLRWDQPTPLKVKGNDKKNEDLESKTKFMSFELGV